MAKTTSKLEEAQAAIDAKGRDIARILDSALNGGGPRKHGFALLLFDFGEPPQPATYLSNGTRADMIRVVEEWLARMKGG